MTMRVVEIKIKIFLIFVEQNGFIHLILKFLKNVKNPRKIFKKMIICFF